MNVSRTARRLATAGVATALAAGALVGAASTTAGAATGDNDYTCQVPTFGEQTIPMHVDVPLLDALPETLPAGKQFGQGDLDTLGGGLPAITMTFKLPAAMAGLLQTAGISALKSGDLALGFGSGSVPVAGITPAGIDAATGVLTATGTNAAFSLPAAGPATISMPKKFVMTPNVNGLGDVPISCETATPQAIKSVELTKSESATAVKAPATVKKGKVAKLVATVSGGFTTPSGKVVFKDGSKKLGTATLNDAGKAVLKAKGLKVGKHSVTAKYAGDGYRTASKSGAVKFKVVK